MKAFFDFLPLILFFIAVKVWDIYVATGVLMVVLTIQIIMTWIIVKKVEKMYIITWAAVVAFGTPTLIFQDPTFIKWAKTASSYIMAAVFIGSQYIGKKPLVELMMDKALEMPKAKWIKLNWSWALFFIFIGTLNIFIAYTFSEAVWVKFKVFGTLALTFVFIIGQMFFLKDYIREPEAQAPGVGEDLPETPE